MNRITYGMSIQRTLLDQQRNMYNMDNILRSMSSRKKYSKPSDNPIDVSKIMRLQTELRVNRTYKDSIADAESWTSKTDDSLRNLKSIIDRMKELLTRAATGSLSTEDKQQIEAELRELKKSAITIANDDYMGKHQFSGHKTDMKFMNEDGTYNKNLNLAGLNYEEINYIIGVSQKTKVNFSGVDVFGNEYYHTNTRSEKYIPFDQDKPKTILGGKVSITIQKYKQLYDDMPKTERPAEYEKDQVLEDVIRGKSYTFEDITFYNSYDKNDINSIVEEMNKSLIDKIRLKALKEYPNNTADDMEKRKALETELRNSVQFVNDNGKIALVTDNDYGLKKISSGNIDFKVIKNDNEVEGTPLENKKIKLEGLGSTQYENAKKSGVLPVATSFDITFKTYKKDEKGDLEVPVKEESTHKINDIVFAKTYNINDRVSNDQMSAIVAQDLKNEINKRIEEYNSTSPNKINPDEIKVVIGKNNEIYVVTDKYNGMSIENKLTSGDNFIEESVTPKFLTNTSPYKPDENKGLNKISIIDFNLNPPVIKNNEDYISNIDFDLTVKAYPEIGGEKGDLLYVGHRRNLESLKKEIEEKTNYLKEIPNKITEKQNLLDKSKNDLPIKQGELKTKQAELKTILEDYEKQKKEFDEKYPLLIIGTKEDKEIDPQRKILQDPKSTDVQKEAAQKEIDRILKERREKRLEAEKKLNEKAKEVSDKRKEINKLNSEISGLNSNITRLPGEIKKLENDKIKLEGANGEIEKLKAEQKKLEDLLKAAGVNPYGKLDLGTEMQGLFKVKLVNKYTGDENRVKSKVKEDIEAQIRAQLPKVNQEMRKALEKEKERVAREKLATTDPKKIEELDAQLSRINSKLSSSKDIITSDDIDVTFNNGDISIKINGHMGYELKENKNTLDIKSFENKPLTLPQAETKQDMDIPIEINADPNGDTHVYMDLNLDITEYKKDEFGDEQKASPNPPIKIDEITLNKKYSRIKPGSNPLEKYSDVEIKKMIAEDIKKAIEDKINALNPPIQKNGIKVEFDDPNNPTKVKLKVSPDIKVKLTHDDINDPISGNSQLSKKPDYVPTHNENGKGEAKKPEREMMPFFEMIDRIMHMCHVGDSEGLSRMQNVLKWHEENNLRVQGEGGGRSNLYKIMTERTKDLEENYKGLLSDTQDTDYAEASANLSLLSYVYRASLVVTAKIIQPSLVDFLR